jgi:hypothetical protein
VRRNRGLALLGSKGKVERYLTSRREYGVWKIDGLFAMEIP